MKKLSILLVCLVSFQAFAMASDDKPIKVTDLPQAAQTFISTHFAGHKVAMAEVESEIFEKRYEVVFTNGDKVEFDKEGAWTEVKCKMGAVPAAIVPSQISAYVKDAYPDAKIMSIERGRHDYEINLSNGWEITFDFNFNVIDLDD